MAENQDEQTIHEPAEVGVPIKITGTANCPAFYANIAGVISNPFDIQILFSELMGADSKGALARAVARVVMTPEQAALLTQALAARLDQHVQMHGKLRNVGIEVAGAKPYRPTDEQDVGSPDPASDK